MDKDKEFFPELVCGAYVEEHFLESCAQTLRNCLLHDDDDTSTSRGETSESEFVTENEAGAECLQLFGARFRLPATERSALSRSVSQLSC